ncbi:MAG: hypothetical protein V1793_03450 [Pseudomonadota bacterium]
MTLTTKAFSLLLYGLQAALDQTARRHKDFQAYKEAGWNFHLKTDR